MKKTHPQAELVTLPDVIRVETALSRLPVHRLIKHGTVPIEIRETTADGELVVQSTTTGAKAPWLVAGRRLVRDHRPIDCGPAGLFRAGTPHRLSRGHGFEMPSRRVRGIRKLGLQVLECL